jgi:hypothetical protein
MAELFYFKVRWKGGIYFLLTPLTSRVTQIIGSFKENKKDDQGRPF